MPRPVPSPPETSPPSPEAPERLPVLTPADAPRFHVADDEPQEDGLSPSPSRQIAPSLAPTLARSNVSDDSSTEPPTQRTQVRPTEPLEEPAGELARSEASPSLRRRSLNDLIALQAPRGEGDEDGGGLREALIRAREEAERRAAEGPAEPAAPQLRPRERSAGADGPMTHTEELPEALGDDRDAPDAVSKATMEVQVKQLNALRRRYMNEQAWDKLVDLYLEKLHLFPSPADQRKVLVNAGVICERKLKDPHKAIDAYERALKIAPDASLFETLDQLYTQVEDWGKLAELVDQELELVEDPGLELDLTIRKAEVLALRLNEGELALNLFRELLQEELATDEREEVLVALAELIQEGGSNGRFLLGAAGLLEAHWGHAAQPELLVRLYEGLFDAFMRQEERTMAAEVMSRIASLHQANERYQEAFVALGQALSCQPGRQDTFMRLEALAERLDALRDLAAIYEDEMDRLDADQAVTVGARLAALYGKLGDLDGVRRSWQLVSEIDPDNVDALKKLRALYVLQGDLEAQLDVLRRMVDVAQGPERLEVLLQIVRLRTAGLDANAPPKSRDVLDMDVAVAMIQEALSEVSPGTEEAQEVMAMAHKLIERSNHAVAYQLAERLEQFHSAAGDHKAIVATYERLAAAYGDDPATAAESARLWARVGQIQLIQLQDPERAFLYYAKAVQVDPQNADAQAMLEDLAQQHNRWDEVALIWEDILEEDSRIPWLRKLARIYRDQLGDEKQAAERFAEILHQVPGDEEALNLLEEHYAAQQDWMALLDVLESRAEASTDPEERAELLTRIAVVSLEKLHDPRGAADHVANLLELLAELEQPIDDVLALYRRTGHLPALADIMESHAYSVRDKQRRTAVQMQRVGLLIEQEQLDKAIDLLVSLRAQEPSDPALRLRILRRLSALYLRAERELEAYAAFRALYEELGSARHARTEEMRAEQVEVLKRLARMAETALGSPDEAAAHYRELLDRDPNNLQVLTELERLYEESANWRGLFESLERHSDLVLTHSDSAVAASVLKERQVEIARDHLKEPAQERTAIIGLMKLRSDTRPSELERLIDLARRLGRWEEALQRSEAFLEHLDAPEDIAAMLIEMAQVARMEVRSNTRAISYLERARKLQPGQRAVLSTLSELYQTEGLHADLVSLWRSTLDHEDELTTAQVVFACRQLARAVEAHERDPRRAAGYLERALVEANEDPDALSPEDAHAIHRHLADLYLQLQDHAAALTHLQALEASTEQLGALYEELGQVALKADKLEASEGYFIRALEQDGQRMTARIGLAEALLAHGKHADAIQLLEIIEDHFDALSEATDRARLYAAFGQAHAAAGRAEKASEMFRVALQHDPENAVAQASVGS
ncbi:MAG: hypothetical protein CMH57_10815 [Myxococcales bacterium]|nr:hypothetical protein [Myxococcales bacterium]